MIKGSKWIDSLIIYVILTQLFLGLQRFSLLILNLIILDTVLDLMLFDMHLDTIIIVIVIIRLNLLQFHWRHATLGFSKDEVLGTRCFFFSHLLSLLLSFLVVAEEVLRLCACKVVFRGGLRSISLIFRLLECLSRDHLDFKAIFPILLGKLHANFMRIFGGLYFAL